MWWEKWGFLPATVDVTVTGVHFPIVVDLTVQPGLEEEVIVVATTRTGRRLDDQPTRVEVLGREEIEEKMLMTPGDIVMMLNEMGGLRVQTTSPSLGAASVRVQGMKGRYTRFLSDGLPLFGQQVGGLGMLEIPPMDLGQVEVIKGNGLGALWRRRDGRRRQSSDEASRTRGDKRVPLQPGAQPPPVPPCGFVPRISDWPWLERVPDSAVATGKSRTIATATSGRTSLATLAVSCGHGSSGTAATDGPRS